MTYQFTETPSRLKRLERSSPENLPPHRLVAKDRQIIQAVYEHRVLTTDQIQQLLFPNKTGRTQCQHRLKLLFHHGYLRRDEQASKDGEEKKPLVYFLDSRGADLLCEEHKLEPNELDWHPRHNTISSLFLGHLLETNEVRIAIEIAAQQRSITLREWLDDKTLKSKQMKDYVAFRGPEGGTYKAAIVPDGYFHLETAEYSFRFFLEADRGTVTGQWDRYGRRSWARKVWAYLEYYRSGMYEQRYGSSKGRVLTVTVSERRLATLKRITEEAEGRDRFWFTTFDQISPETILTGRVWQKAGYSGLFTLT